LNRCIFCFQLLCKNTSRCGSIVQIQHTRNISVYEICTPRLWLWDLNWYTKWDNYILQLLLRKKMFAIKIVFLETTLILGVLYLYEYFLDSLCFVGAELTSKMAVTYCLYIFHFNISIYRDFVCQISTIYSFFIAQTIFSIITLECFCYNVIW
jgi:hypothetical protein